MREYLLVLLVAACIAYLVTGGVRVLAIRQGVVLAPRARDVHSTAIPRMGGAAVFAGVLAACFVARNLPTLRETFENSSEVIGVVIAGGLICLLGAADDRWGLDALSKLAGQIACLGIMIMFGVQFTLLYIPVGGVGTLSLNAAQSVVLTTLVGVITINAVNFVDGLDGLAAGTVAIAALAFFVYSYYLSRVQGYQVAAAPTLIAALLAGACIGFLPHNFQPARILTGDWGSMLMGLMLVATAVTSTGRIDPQTFGTLQLLPLLLPVLLPLFVLAVPLLDLVLAVVRRLKRGTSVFEADKQHLHHRLLALGHSHRGAVFVMYLWTALVSSSVLALALISTYRHVWIAPVAAAACLVIVLGARRRPAPEAGTATSEQTT